MNMGIDVVKIFSKSFSSLINNKAIMGLALIAAALQIITALATSGFGIIAIVVTAIMALIGVLITGSVFISTTTKITTEASIKKATKKYINLLITSIIAGVIVGLGFVALILPGIFLAIKLSMAPVYAVLDKTSPIQSIEKSWNKTKGHWWNVFGVLLSVGLVSLVIMLVFKLITLPLGSIVSAIIGGGVGGFVSIASAIAITYVYKEIG